MKFDVKEISTKTYIINGREFADLEEGKNILSEEEKRKKIHEEALKNFKKHIKSMSDKIKRIFKRKIFKNFSIKQNKHKKTIEFLYELKIKINDIDAKLDLVFVFSYEPPPYYDYIFNYDDFEINNFSQKNKNKFVKNAITVLVASYENHMIDKYYKGVERDLFDSNIIALFKGMNDAQKVYRYFLSKDFSSLERKEKEKIESVLEKTVEDCINTLFD